MPALLYDSETMIYIERERSRIMVVQMDSVKGLLGIRRIGRVPNTRIRELCEVTKGVTKLFPDGSSKFE